MLYAKLQHFNQADYQSVERVLELLQERDYSQVEDGRIPIDETTYIQILSYETEDISGVDFERHHHRFDTHYIVEGREVIYLSADTDVRPIAPYNPERDIEFLEPPKEVNKIILEKGDFLVIGLDEPHKTNGWVDGRPEFVKKVVIKTSRSNKA